MKNKRDFQARTSAKSEEKMKTPVGAALMKCSKTNKKETSGLGGGKEVRQSQKVAGGSSRRR